MAAQSFASFTIINDTLVSRGRASNERHVHIIPEDLWSLEELLVGIPALPPQALYSYS